MPKKNIVWIASYPKSGNTWTRIFLANYLINAPRPVPLNQLSKVMTGDGVAQHFRAVNNGHFDPNDRMGNLAARRRVLQRFAGNGADLNLIKTHNLNADRLGHKLIPSGVTKAALYVVRHPLDTAISYSRHLGWTPDETVAFLSRSDTGTTSDSENAEQYLGSWSDHVASWTQARGFPVFVMRYEDLLESPAPVFGDMLSFIGLDPDPARLEKAVRFSTFDEAKRQEASAPFRENPGNHPTFFTEGRAGQWQDVIDHRTAMEFARSHRKMMRKFNYTVD